MRIRLATLAAVTATTVGLTVAPASAANPALTYVPNPSWWGTNGRVVQILPAGNRVYLAGSFDYVGPATGYGVGVDGTNGARLPGAPMIDGPVYTAIPDGAGGWYIGGAFTHVGGFARPRAAHITAGGTVTKWNPKPDGPVYALAVVGSTVVVGGDFATIGQTPVAATRLAAVDNSLGNEVWAASANAPVRALVATGGSLYVGGDFSYVDGQSHSGLARVNASSGSLDTTFAGRTQGSVESAALSADGTTLYLGGKFSSAYNGTSWQTRTRLAAFATSGGALTSWAPAADNTVDAVAVDPTAGTIYVGGLFLTVGGIARANLAALDGAGSVLAFDAALSGCNTPHVTKYDHSDPPCVPEVDSLSASGGNLYVGGRFGRSGASVRHDAAAFSLTTGTLTGWDPVASNRVLALAPAGSNVFVGGELTSVNGVVHAGIAALDATTGALDPTFTTQTNDMVLSMALSPDGSRLYLGGHFTSVNGQTRNRLASVLTTDGSVDPTFKAAPNNDVLGVGVANNALYVVGQFKRIGSVARAHTAKLSLVDGSVDPTFTANTNGPAGTLTANGMVEGMALSPDGSKFYIGGPFSTVNGTSQQGIAVVDAHSGALLPHQLGGLKYCWAGGAWITHLYLSPDGQRLYGGDVCPDDIYQWDAVNLSTYKTNGLNWRTLCNAGMQGTLEINGHFYYGTHGGDKGKGGYCYATPSGPQVAQQRYFVFDSATGNLLPDQPEFDSPMGVWSFAVIPQGLLVGGDFSYAGAPGQIHQGLALFPGTP